MEEAVAWEEWSAEKEREVWFVAAEVECGVSDAFGAWFGGDDVPCC